MGVSWLRRNSLGRDDFALFLGFLLLDQVSLESSEEGISASGLSDVLMSNINSLGHDSVSNSLVDLNTDSSWADGEDLSGLSVIAFVRHSSVNCTVSYDIDEVAHFVNGQIFRRSLQTMLFVWPGVHVSGPSPVSK
mgnify:FL=1